MKRCGKAIVLVAAALLLSVAPTPAQEAKSPFEGKRVIGIGQPGGDKIQIARRLLSGQRYQEAGDLLETIYETDPNNEQVQSLLRACYDQSKQYQKAELLARKMLEKQPGNFGLRLYLAETLVRLTRVPEALAEYDRVVGTFDQMGRVEATGHFRALIRSLVSSDLDSVALVRIGEVRTKMDESTLFAAERGGIFEKRQQYVEAVREYLPALVQDTSVEALQAEKRLLALLDFDGSSAPVERLLKGVADSTSSVRVMSLLADHYLKVGEFDEAFSFCLRRDSLEGGSGLPLVAFARSCQERRCWSQVVQMSDIILLRHPEAAFATDASFQKAHALAELGRPEEAADVYRRVADGTDNYHLRGDAVYGLGVLYSDYLHDYEKALACYDSIVTTYLQGQRYIMARKAIPICHMHLGHLTEARRLLAELLQSRLPEELQEEAVYLTGLVEFFDKKYDTAEAIFRKLMVDYPRGFFVNDALGLVLAIGDAQSSGSALDDYSGASYAQYRGKVDSARACLLAMADAQPPVLGDLALYELTRMELHRADSAAALQFLDRLDKDHHESYYRPLGMKLKADIMAQPGRDPKQAMEIYRVLLEKYSEYPFVREVRERLRDLDSRVPAS